MWQKPEDLILIAECETMPEALLIEGLLNSSGIKALVMTGSDQQVSMVHLQLNNDPHKRKPFKVLVHPQDESLARELLTSPHQDEQDGDGEVEDD